ncbi:hypothetical protein [Streptomyces sp. NPDC020817]|uniref:hypothetical protein n=1 Tax=Streptomyces sp. NPDC020817 TaxID=3365095 RepID=UPI0037B65463
MSTFDHKFVDGFIRTMERNGAGLATQSHCFDQVKSVLLDAYRLGIYTADPVLGVPAPNVRSPPPPRSSATYAPPATTGSS